MSPRGADRAPLRLVTKVIEVRGPRGGTIHALVLECGCFVTRRLKTMAAAPERAPCVGCYVRGQMTLEPIVHARARIPIGDREAVAKAAQEREGWTRTECGVSIRVDDGGWVWLRQAVTCPRCAAAMLEPPRRKRRR